MKKERERNQKKREKKGEEIEEARTIVCSRNDPEERQLQEFEEEFFWQFQKLQARAKRRKIVCV